MKTVKNPQVNITFDQLENIKCDCGSKYFTTIVELKIIPKILDPGLTEDLLKPVLGYRCIECGVVKEEY